MKRPFLMQGVLGLVVICYSLYLSTLFPLNLASGPSPYGSPIIAFEFVTSQDEVLGLFGAEDSSHFQSEIDRMDSGNKADFIFAILYAFFLGAIGYKMFGLRKERLFLVIVLLAVLAGAFDVLENIQLLAITEKIYTADFALNVFYLQWFTWIKWFSLAFIFALFSKFLIRGGVLQKTMAIIGSFTILFGAAAFFFPVMFIKVFTINISLMFLLSLIFCFSFKGVESRLR